MSDAAPTPPTPDTRDWLVVLDGGCEQCGWRPHPPAEAAARLEEAALRWRGVLGRADVADRPSAAVWSPLEYACHVRDVIRVWAERAGAMLTRDNPAFASFDGDRVALERRYWAEDPARVAGELEGGASVTARLLAGLSAQQWDRPGHRGDGAPFTVATLSLYFSHELTHHLEDVGA